MNKKTLIIIFALALVVGFFFWLRPVFLNEDDNESFVIEREVDPEQTLTYFQVGTGEGYNRFEHEDGLFRFEYLNHLAVKENRGIYFLEDIRDQTVVFQIFERHDGLDFDENAYICDSYQGDDPIFEGKTLCFSAGSPDQIVANLELFAVPDTFLIQDHAFVMGQATLTHNEFRRFDFFTRAQMLELALSIQFPDTDFGQYAAQCFEDVGPEHPLSGYICYAKDEGIVMGIGEYYYPESSINLFGILKILFLVFEVEDQSFDASAIDLELFEKMNQGHYAFPLIAKGLYEGIIQNPSDQLLWSNQNLYKGDVMEITSRFLRWREGRVFTNYDSPLQSETVGFITIEPETDLYRFESENKPDVDDPEPIESVLIEDGAIHVSDRGNLLIRTMMVGEDGIASVWGIENYGREQIGLTVNYSNGEKVYYETHPLIDQYVFLKDDFSESAFEHAKEKLMERQLLPSSVEIPDDNQVPQMDIFMDEMDFLNIFIHRTSDQRYPAHLVLTYPNGEVVERSVLIKTRGNATRGYIKSSYTIEAFENFEDVNDFDGDEFLADHDEMKLRSFINEETLLHEKLFYRSFEAMGQPAPEFFESTVTINGVNMGFYQVTEPIKKDFFRRRDIDTENYFYATNVASVYETNLGYHVDDETTLSQYELKGDAAFLLDFIQRLAADDPELIEQINVQNVFDYALITYLSDANDSLTHNFYVYWDEDLEQWNIFPWDADETFSQTFAYSQADFEAYVGRTEGLFNHLIRYTFAQMDEEAFEAHFNDFKDRWNSKVQLVQWVQDFQNRYANYFDFENELWNGRHLERKLTVFETNEAVEELVELVEVIDFL